jgi:hypothetical protein
MQSSEPIFKYGLDTLLIAGFLNLAVTASAWGQQPQDNYQGAHMMWNGGWWLHDAQDTGNQSGALGRFRPLM